MQDKQSQKRKPSRKVLLIFCILILAVVMIVGTAYARFLISSETGVEFTASKNQSAYLKSTKGLSANDDGTYDFVFSVTNGESAESFAANDMDVAFTVISTERDTAPSSLTLTIGGVKYTATATATNEKNVIGKAYGKGYTYHFLNAGKDDITTALTGGVYSSVSASINIKGAVKGTTYTLYAYKSSQSVFDGTSALLSIRVPKGTTTTSATWGSQVDLNKNYNVYLGKIDGQKDIKLLNLSGDEVVTVSDDTWVTASISSGNLSVYSPTQLQVDGSSHYRPDTEYVTVTKTVGGTAYTTNFYITMAEDSNVSGTFTLVNDVDWYNAAAPIILQTGSTQTVIKYNTTSVSFPAGTIYTIGTKSYLLYAPMALTLPANSTVYLNVSNLSAATSKQSLTISGEKGATTLKYKNWQSNYDISTPLVLDSENVDLSIPYTWGKVTTTYSIKKLSIESGAEKWDTASGVKLFSDSTTSNVTLNAADATPGTYMATLEWRNSSGVVLYSITFEFNVFHK